MSDASPSTVADGKVVIFHFTLTNAAGEVIESSFGDEPMPYLHGSQGIVPGLERAMDGRPVGDTFKVELSPADGFGEVMDGWPQKIPRESAPDLEGVEVGTQLLAEGPDGNAMPIWVVHTDETYVHVDANHPFAGETLTFDVEVVAVREATDDERAHGHPHGLDGTAHHH
ncbi:MAG: peptidylprolyl isomerase [Myxococcota bacterium]|nr:peptidylprolyl isomerase [Myxococcota bacterium]